LKDLEYWLNLQNYFGLGCQFRGGYSWLKIYHKGGGDKGRFIAAW